ncbi:MAG TPA: hypothetical protein VGR25_05325 [bacterium]|jgi:hypothetical protein|nr:hypothetical protein [bacterium]
MPSLTGAYGFVRFLLQLRPFLAKPISIGAAERYVRERMAAREASFLWMAERAIYAQPQSPYRQLLTAAGIESEDLRAMVRAEGVESTLARLSRAGVYVTFDEFKGRKPAVRGSQTFSWRDADFDNPLIGTQYHGRTGGTGGRPTRLKLHLDHVAQSAPNWAIWFAAHGWLGRPLLFWIPSYFAVNNRFLMGAKFGQPPVRRFSPLEDGPRQRSSSALREWLVRWATGFPTMEVVPLAEAWRVGEALVQLLDQGMQPCLNTSSSAAVRVALAMMERGRSLGGVSFLLGGEPVTSDRRETIEASGAKAVATYGFSEAGGVGVQCPQPRAADDVHLFLDAFAVIQRPLALADGSTVGALLFATLRPAASKVMLNTEIGDHAVMETRSCGCSLDRFGYLQHLHTIRSYEKLTGEGVTFVGADIFHLFEAVLPRRFGGTIFDYQLIEQYGGTGGLPHYDLLVSPEVGRLDERELLRVFFQELGRLRPTYRISARLWDEAAAVRVKRERPMLTPQGKVLPFRRMDGA